MDWRCSGAAADPQAAQAASWINLFPEILLYGPLCVAGAWAARKLRFPTAFMLGPMIVMCVIHLTTTMQTSPLPSSLLNISQLMIGSHVGLMLRPQHLQRKTQTITLAVLSSVLLIAGSLGLSYVLMQLFSLSPATSLLSMAPGGMDQMSIMAHEVNANLSVVSGYQLFRILFIFFIVSSVLKLLLTHAEEKKSVLIPPDPEGQAPKRVSLGCYPWILFGLILHVELVSYRVHST